MKFVFTLDNFFRGIWGSIERISELFSEIKGLLLNMIRKIHYNLHFPLKSLIN